MSPAHFYELVSLTEPLLPRGRRGPAAIPAAWRIFAVLFWLAQGGSQRVVARASDVARSTFSKFCDPVIQGMLAALPIPSWPTQSERLDIICEFSEMTGGNAVGWAGLYVSCLFFLCCSCTTGAGDLYMLAGRELRLRDFPRTPSALATLLVACQGHRATRWRFGPDPGTRRCSRRT